VPFVELNKRKQILRKGSLFRDLADEDLNDLALLLSEERFHVGDEVILQHQKNDRLYIVASGALVVATADEQLIQTVITAFGSGDIFGEMEILDEEISGVTVGCLSDVTLYTLSRSDLITLLYAKPQVGLEMMRELTRRMRSQRALLRWVQQTASPTLSTETSLNV
jgi:CRP-like cAMP-binding protein